MVLTKTKKIISSKGLMKKAVRIFNHFILTRDREKGCVSCNSYKVAHASHFFSAGKYPALRFNTDNVNGACIQCNMHLNGNLLEYRMRLLRKIGQQRMDLLEATATRHRLKKYDRLELEIIIQTYKQAA